MVTIAAQAAGVGAYHAKMRLRLATLLLVGVSLLASCDNHAIVLGDDLQSTVAAAPPRATLRLPSGRYKGPIVIDKPLKLIAEEGAVVTVAEGEVGVLISGTRDVTVRNLHIIGGEAGVLVRNSVGVEIEGVRVEGARRHGIVIRDAEASVVGCDIRKLESPFARGVEIVNSDRRPPSVVDGCRVQGPVFEGIVSRLSLVRFRSNEVVGSVERGVVITEMSVGDMEHNRVTDGFGNAFFCGDMSICSVVDNRAVSIRPTDREWQSSQGHGLVVHFHSVAFVEDLDAEAIAGEDIVTLVGGSVSREPIDTEPSARDQ